jgi:hypothetical protein
MPINPIIRSKTRYFRHVYPTHDSILYALPWGLQLCGFLNISKIDSWIDKLSVSDVWFAIFFRNRTDSMLRFYADLSWLLYPVECTIFIIKNKNMTTQNLDMFRNYVVVRLHVYDLCTLYLVDWDYKCVWPIYFHERFLFCNFPILGKFFYEKLTSIARIVELFSVANYSHLLIKI